MLLAVTTQAARKRRYLTALAAALCCACAWGDDNLVNERPPVTALQLQQHWQVDCPALRSSLLNATDQKALTKFTVKQLGQCAIIYQRFPEALTTPCNGYQRAVERLRKAPPLAARLALVQRALRCDSTAE